MLQDLRDPLKKLEDAIRELRERLYMPPQLPYYVPPGYQPPAFVPLPQFVPSTPSYQVWC